MRLSKIIHERIAKWRPIRIVELLLWAHQSEDNERRIAQLEAENEALKKENLVVYKRIDELDDLHP